MSQSEKQRVSLTMGLPQELFDKLGGAEGLAKILAKAGDTETRHIYISSNALSEERRFPSIGGPFC